MNGGGEKRKKRLIYREEKRVSPVGGCWRVRKKGREFLGTQREGMETLKKPLRFREAEGKEHPCVKAGEENA